MADEGELAVAALPVVQIGDPVLRRVASPLRKDEIHDPSFNTLVDQMRVTMYEARGVGLAAPQVGIRKRLCVVEDAESDDERDERFQKTTLPFTVMCNPSYVVEGTETAEFFEGCLSAVGLRGLVRRPLRITATWTDEHAETRTQRFEGWAARIIQHEVDHLDGVLYVDRSPTRSMITDDAYFSTWVDADIDGFKRAFDIGRETRPLG